MACGNPSPTGADNPYVNVFRALARELFQRSSTDPSSRRDPVSLPQGSLQPVRERRVAQVLSSSRFGDTFDRFDRLPGMQTPARAAASRASRPTHGLAMDNPVAVERAMRQLASDSFTPARREPVNLLGTASHAMELHADERPAAVASNGFFASLDDLF